MGRHITAAFCFLSCIAFSSVQAQDRYYHVYIDSDNETTTGCDVNIPDFATTLNGIDSRVTITTNSALPPAITNSSIHTCTGAAFDAGVPVNAAALGFNTGFNGSDVFETSIDRTDLLHTSQRSLRAYFATDTAVADDVVLTNSGGGAILLGFPFAIPTLSLFGLLLIAMLVLLASRKQLHKRIMVSVVLVGVATVALAMSIVVDGQTNDWMNIGPANTDPVGDTSAAGNYADLTAVYLTQQNDVIFFRMDVSDLENQAPTITTAAAVSVVENQTAVIDVNSTDPEGDVEGAGLSYTITGAVDDALFTINPNTGVLTFLVAPDFENPSDVGADNVYNVQVTVTDSGAATDVQDLAVTVTNDVVDDTSVAFQTANSNTVDEGTALNVVVQLTASAPLTAAVSIDVVDAGGGSATSGSDYTAFGTQTVTFPMGATNGTTQNVILTPNDDVNVENNETVNLQLQNISGPALIGSQTAHVVSITEDDVATVEFDTAASGTVDENTPLDITVRLNIPSGGQLDVAVSADVVDAGTGTATSGVDYTAFGTQMVTFPIGSTNANTQNTTLTPLDDPNSKGNETVDLALQNLTGPPAASLGTQTTHTVTITDDEAAVSFQVTSSSTVDEGTNLNVAVVLSTPIPLTAPVSVDVIDVGGGSAISGTDFIAFGTQTVTFPLGSTNGTIQNAVLSPIDDNNVENNETVNLELQNLVGTGSIGTQNTHTVTITEDDTASVAFQAASSATVNEGTPLNISVLLTIPSGGQLDIAVSADVIDAGGGSATSGVDYNVFGTQAITFPVGTGNGATQTSTLTPIDDPNSEGNETVNLALQNLVGPISASLGAPTAHTATITDDEASVVFQNIASSTIDEGTALNIPVVLSTPIPLGAPLSVDVVDAGGGSATSAADYTAIGTQTVTFPMGSTNGATQNANFNPIDDTNVENNETVNLQLQNLVGSGSIGTQSTQTITITENDTATVEFQAANSATVDESTALNINVLLNIPSGGQLDVAITLDAIDAGGGSATSGVDYTAFGTQMLTFPVGSNDGATQNTTLTPLDDVATEGDETVNLQLQNLAGPILAGLGAQTTHTATITDDDNTAPTANPDSYETIGNTGLNATAGAPSTPILHPQNLIFNDTDPELDPLVVSEAMGDLTAPFTGTGTMGGDVVVQANGDFTYYPPVGVTGITDTFDYTVSDGSLTSSATVSITVTADLVYYVDNTAAAGGTGRDDARFDQLSDVPAAAANTTVFVFQGAGDTTGAITMGANQVLIGNGVNLEFNVNNTLPNPDVLIPAAGRPTLTGTSTLGTNNTIRGLNIGNTGAQTGITGNNFGTATINNVAINGTGKALDLTTGTAAMTFDSIASTNSASEGVDLSEVSGNFTVTGLTNITNPAQIGVNIQNSNLIYTFGDVTVNNRNSAGVFINAFTGGTQTGTFGNVVINNQNTSPSTAFGIDNTVTGGSIINVASVAIDNNGSNSSAIALSNNDGATININGGSVQGAAGAAVSISSSAGNATYAGSINNTAGRSLQVLNNTGGVTTLSGNITDSGTGIFVNNNTGSTINFSGTIDLDTTTNTAFTATGGGTVNATGSSSTINTSSGIAVDVQNTTIGASNLTFQSISAGTGAGTAGVGINLVNTGNAGGLAVTGVASNASSGGVIQNKNGANGSTAGGIGIHLNNTSNVSLRNMQLGGFDNFAIRGTTVTNFTMIDSVVNANSGNSAADDEGAISFTNLLGTSVFSGNNVAGGFEDQIKITNTTGTSSITVNDSANDAAVIGLDANPAGTNGNDGILVESQMAAQINLTVDGVEFLGARGDMIQTNALNTSNFTTLIQNNSFNNSHPNIVPGGGGITLSGGGAGANITKGYDVLNSNFTGAVGNATTVNFVSGAGTVSGEVTNNMVGTNGVPASGSTTASGISIGASANVQHNTTIDNNQVRGVSGFAGIETVANTDVNFNATIINNVVEQLAGNVLGAMYNLVGGAGTETGTACLDVRSNTFDASAAPFAGHAVLKDQISATANFNLPGYTGSPNGEFAFACATGTAGVNAGAHHAGNFNTMTNGPFPFIVGGVDATIVCGMTGIGTSCPQ